MSVRTLRSLPKPTALPSSSITSTTTHHHHPRLFLTAATTASAPQTITATRTLHYPTLPLYNLIADISSYPSYVPLCTAATVTSLSRPDAHYDKRWPQRASLTIGYGNSITESFTSRVFCVPPVEGEMGRAGVGYVEAVSGSETFVEEEVRKVFEGGDEKLAHHDRDLSPNSNPSDSKDDFSGGPLEMLRTRWSVRGFPFKPAPVDGKALHGYDQGTPQDARGKSEDGENSNKEEDLEARDVTDVTLTIEFKFRNFAYDVMSRAVAPTLAERMIEAFERRVESVLGKESK